jgi:hypothetical protein
MVTSTVWAISTSPTRPRFGRNLNASPLGPSRTLMWIVKLSIKASRSRFCLPRHNLFSTAQAGGSSRPRAPPQT